MPIVVKNPYESVGAGIRTAGSALGSALGDITTQRRKREDEVRTERRKMEAEQRGIQQKQQFLQFESNLGKQQRAERRQELMEKNQELGSALYAGLDEYQSKLKPGEEISDFDLSKIAFGLTKNQGIEIGEASRLVKDVYGREDRAIKRQDKKILDEERQIARNTRFENTVTELAPNIVGKDRNLFMNLSEKHSGITDPTKRFKETEKDYNRIENELSSYTKTLDSPGFMDKYITGLSENKINTLKDKTQNLIRQGIPEEKLEAILLDKGFNAIEIENFVSPLSTRESKALSEIPKSVRVNLASRGSVFTPRNIEQVDRQLKNLPSHLVKVLQDGGSARMAAEELLRKGYSREDIDVAFTSLLDMDLKPRQRKQIQEIKQTPRRRTTLSNIFGD